VTLDGAPDRFLVSLGLLGLLDAICDKHGPVLCCVDDAQWLDQPSAEALVFAARRLDAEPMAVLIAARDDDVERLDASGLPVLELRGLDDEHARALLSIHLDRAPSPGIMATLVSTARGNPLALLELSCALSDAQLDGLEPILGPPPVRGDVQAAFGPRVARLPGATRLVLLLAAADDAGDVPAVERAAERMGAALSDLEPAELDGLVRVDRTVAFRHPLLRSVVYHLATRGERRAAHEALAAVLDDRLRGAWHRALIAEGADEGIAAELAQGAEQAAHRGAHSMASAAFERAAELSRDPTQRGRHLCRAARAALDAGRLDAAVALADRARPFVSDPADAAQLTVIRAIEQSRRGSVAEADALLQHAGTAADEWWSAFVALQRGRDERALDAVVLGRCEHRDAVTTLRAERRMPELVAMLTVVAAAEVSMRRVRDAATTVAEAIELARSLGLEHDETVLLGVRARVAAFEGREEDCRHDAAEAIRRGAANGLEWATVNARLALAELELGLGNAREAMMYLDQLRDCPFPAMVAIAASNCVDGALRLGETDVATLALDRIATSADRPPVPAILARCRAQLADDATIAERYFLEALELHADDVAPFERARTELAYGERLRRERRKIDARTRLRSALDTFEGLGAALWAERARGELRATGETARKRDVTTIDDLTPQELRIAELVAAGASNRDVATQLFVSTKTIEYHLRKVFQKCGVASRFELARMPLHLHPAS
jgi:DNA-binding CsgD family transcriptional regulator